MTLPSLFSCLPACVHHCVWQMLLKLLLTYLLTCTFPHCLPRKFFRDNFHEIGLVNIHIFTFLKLFVIPLYQFSISLLVWSLLVILVEKLKSREGFRLVPTNVRSWFFPGLLPVFERHFIVYITLRPISFNCMHHIVSHWIALYIIASDCSALNCITSHCNALHCNALHNYALHSFASHHVASHCIRFHHNSPHCL